MFILAAPLKDGSFHFWGGAPAEEICIYTGRLNPDAITNCVAYYLYFHLFCFFFISHGRAYTPAEVLPVTNGFLHTRAPRLGFTLGAV